MAQINLTFKVSTVWWLKPYCYAMVTMYALTGRTPTPGQLTEWVMKGVTLKAEQ